MSQPRRGRCELSVTDAAVAINNSGLFRVDLRRAFEKYQRRKWGKPGLEKGWHTPSWRAGPRLSRQFATLLRQRSSVVRLWLIIRRHLEHSLDDRLTF